MIFQMIGLKKIRVVQISWNTVKQANKETKYISKVLFEQNIIEHLELKYIEFQPSNYTTALNLIRFNLECPVHLWCMFIFISKT